ncbi:MAG: mannose-1-phosphate guanylyltransferase [Sphingomonadales bacterium]
MNSKNTYGLIMAGGVGSRFWPLSTTERPKQFLDVLGIGKSLLRLTFERLNKFIPSEHIYILTNTSYEQLVLEQLPELNAGQVLCEPERKNTAPCIAYAAAKINALDPDATLLVSPADHLIINEARFEQIIETAWQTAQNGQLVTLGIEPTRPDTGYGYIEFEKTENTIKGSACPVLQFREKPNLASAEAFLLAGNFFWNAGIFVWKAAVVLDALKSHQQDVYDIFSAQPAVYGTDQEVVFLQKAFAACPDISIDFAIMEKAQNVSMILADFDWSDLGTWGSLTTHLQKDEQQNSIIGQNVHAFDTNNCLVNVPANKTVLLDGLQDYIVVDSHDKLMVLRVSNEQKLKEYLKSMGLN